MLWLSLMRLLVRPGAKEVALGSAARVWGVRLKDWGLGLRDLGYRD